MDNLEVIIGLSIGDNIHFYNGKSWISDYRLGKVMKGSAAEQIIDKMESASGNKGYVFSFPANPLLWKVCIMSKNDAKYLKSMTKLAKDFHILEK